MSKKITLTIDGSEVHTQKGASVLEAALHSGYYIPHLCHDPELRPHGGCRLCIVKIQGMKGLPASCTTPAAEGMKVVTSDAELNRVRRDTLELLLSAHPLDCLACGSNQRCELQEAAAYIGGLERKLRRTGKSTPLEEITPFFSLDNDYCILCQKCVRACDEVARKDILTIINRGPESRVASFASTEQMISACRDCMECVKRCPTAALRLKNGRGFPYSPGEKLLYPTGNNG